MRNLTLILTLSSTLGSFASASSYCNTKYSFCASVPDSLSPRRIPDGSGQEYLNKDRTIDLMIWAESVKFESYKDSYINDLNNPDLKITYKLYRDDFYVLSGMTKGRIFYKRVILNPSKDNFVTVLVEYHKINSVTNKIVNDLKSYVTFPKNSSKSTSSVVTQNQDTEMLNYFENKYGIKFLPIGNSTYGAAARDSRRTDVVLIQPSKNLICSAVIPIPASAVNGHGPSNRSGEYDVYTTVFGNNITWGYVMGAQGTCIRVR